MAEIGRIAHAALQLDISQSAVTTAMKYGSHMPRQPAVRRRMRSGAAVRRTVADGLGWTQGVAFTPAMATFREYFRQVFQEPAVARPGRGRA